MTFPRLKSRSKREAAYLWLRNGIIRGRLQPGDQLVIDDLARKLDVSTIPIREALQQLEAEGFVAIRPYAGASVAAIHPDLIFEIFAILEAVEVTSGRMACEKIDEDQLAQLRQILEDLDALEDDVDAWSQANIHFHEVLCDAAGTVLIRDVLDRMLSHWDRLRRYYLQDVFGRRLQKAQKGHWEMFRALEARDPDAIERAARRHNRAALSAYIDHLREVGLTDTNVSVFWTET
jgi:DNA-binding GntR family transcriptional regulator